MNIHTRRLELKSITDKDRYNVIDILTDSKIKKTYMIPDFETEEQLEKMFQRFKELSLKEGFYQAGIFLEEEFIGWVNEVERENNKIELGYVIATKHHNKGYATEMLDAMITKLHEDGFSEVITGAFEGNLASMRVMEKCGMTKLDKIDKIEYRGVVHNCVYYSKQNPNE